MRLEVAELLKRGHLTDLLTEKGKENVADNNNNHMVSQAQVQGGRHTYISTLNRWLERGFCERQKLGKQ